MPELPEVETTLRAILPVLKDKKILDVEVLRRNMVMDPDTFPKKIKGHTVKNVERQGKYLLIALDHGMTLIIHLRMSGRLGLRKASDPPLSYERVRFHLPSNLLLIFNDPRTLGRAYVIPTNQLPHHPPLKKLGPDALTVSEKEFVDRLSRKRGILKSVLLNQSFVAGIGNIYADESCFVAKVDPRRTAQSLTPAEKKRLHAAVIETLEKGVSNMGTSFSDFADLFGKPGKNQRSLFVYGRSGKKCHTCGTILQRTVIGQRGTVWCPKCQQ